MTGKSNSFKKDKDENEEEESCCFNSKQGIVLKLQVANLSE